MFTKKYLLVLFSIVLVVATLPVEAALQLPNYATGGGNLTADLQAKGKSATDIISLIVAMLAIIGILIGAGYYAVAKGEQGKTWVVGGAIALIIAGSVYGIASLMA